MRRTFFVVFAVGVYLFCVPLVRGEDRKDWPLKGVTIGAAPVGGVYYVWSKGPTKILDEKLGIQAFVESTGGPIHNIQLVNTRQLHFGMVTAAPAYEGWHGHGWAKGKKYQNVRVIFPMYTTYFHMYALKRTEIKSLKDLTGKNVGTGPVGGTPATYWPLIFEAGGVRPQRIVNGSSADLDRHLQEGHLDANGQSVGLPWGLVLDVEATREIAVLGVEPDIAGPFVAQYPFFSKGTIPGGTYKSAPNDLQTLTVWNFFVTYKEMPDAFVYAFVKEIFKHKQMLVAIHASAKELGPENVLFSPIPLHPGAVQYYEDVGIKIPQRLKG